MTCLLLLVAKLAMLKHVMGSINPSVRLFNCSISPLLCREMRAPSVTVFSSLLCPSVSLLRSADPRQLLGLIGALHLCLTLEKTPSRRSVHPHNDPFSSFRLLHGSRPLQRWEDGLLMELINRQTDRQNCLCVQFPTPVVKRMRSTSDDNEASTPTILGYTVLGTARKRACPELYYLA